MSSASGYIDAVLLLCDGGGDGEVSGDKRFKVVVDENGEFDVDDRPFAGGAGSSEDFKGNWFSAGTVSIGDGVRLSSGVSSSTGANFLERMLRAIELSEKGRRD